MEECFTSLAPYIKSTHIKDSRMDPRRLTTLLEECTPGEGGLDLVSILQTIDRTLPKDAPVLLEHLATFERYSAAYEHLKKAADQAGVSI